jgi:hypothetical protein
MTGMEAETFVREILKGLWPRWNPNEEELRGWTNRLKAYDYEKSRSIVNNLFFLEKSRGIDPPAGKILKALRKQSKAKQCDPILLYTLVRQNIFNKGRKSGMRFYANDDNMASQVIEQEADKVREQCDAMYNCKHMILRHWEEG